MNELILTCDKEYKLTSLENHCRMKTYISAITVCVIHNSHSQLANILSFTLQSSVLKVTAYKIFKIE